MLFVADTQTTGLDYRDAGLIEIGCVAIEGGRIVSEWSSLVWPGRQFLHLRHRAALEVSGIRVEELLDAREAGDVAIAFGAWVSAYRHGEPFRITSFNVEFDRPFVDPLLALTDEFPEWGPCIMLACQEPMREAGVLGRRSDGSWRFPSLAAACWHFGVALEGAHRALADARAAGLLAIALGMDSPSGQE